MPSFRMREDSLALTEHKDNTHLIRSQGLFSGEGERGYQSVAIVTIVMAELREPRTPNLVRFYVTHDDVTLRIQGVSIENDTSYTVRITAYGPDGDNATHIAQPGEYNSLAFPPNRQYFLDQWTVGMGGA